MSDGDDSGDDRGDDRGDGSGDAVCWLGKLCPDCGAMPSEGTDRCWRCGAPQEREAT